MPVADIGGVVQQIRPVSADVKHYRDHTGRVNTAGRSVDGELADRNLNSAHTRIADSQNVLGIGGEDEIDVTWTGAEVGERRFDGFDMIDGEVHASRTPALMMVLLHRHADGQIVDNGNHFM